MVSQPTTRTITNIRRSSNNCRTMETTQLVSTTFGHKPRCAHIASPLVGSTVVTCTTMFFLFYCLCMQWILMKYLKVFQGVFRFASLGQCPWSLVVICVGPHSFISSLSLPCRWWPDFYCWQCWHCCLFVWAACQWESRSVMWMPWRTC